MKSSRPKPSLRLMWLIFLAVCSALLLFHTTFLLQIPPVWPDESFIADSALNILNEGRNGTNLFGGTVKGAETSGWGYPPLYFYTTALWFKIFDFSIYNFRLLSLISGIIFLSLFSISLIKLTNVSLKNKTALGVFLGLVVIFSLDEAILKATHIARPEMHVLIFGFASLYFYLKSLSGKGSPLYSFLCGLLLGVSFLFHYLAIIFASAFFVNSLILEKRRLFLNKNNWIILFSFLAPVLFWFGINSGNAQYLLNNVLLRLEYKLTSPFWLWMVFASSPLPIKLLYISYFIITWEMIALSWISKNKHTILITLLLLFSWFWTYQWQAEYSFVFTVVFAYFSLSYLILTNLTSKTTPFSRSKLIYALIALIIVINFWNTFRLTQNFTDNKYDYYLYAEQILGNIPDNTTVYISAIPDPYFVFKERNRNNLLYEYPIFPTSKESLLKVLDDSDYIIFNSPLESIVVGDIVSPYITANAEEIIPASLPSQYEAFIVKLKPKGQRKHE